MGVLSGVYHKVNRPERAWLAVSRTVRALQGTLWSEGMCFGGHFFFLQEQGCFNGYDVQLSALALVSGKTVYFFFLLFSVKDRPEWEGERGGP